MDSHQKAIPVNILSSLSPIFDHSRVSISLLTARNTCFETYQGSSLIASGPLLLILIQIYI